MNEIRSLLRKAAAGLETGVLLAKAHQVAVIVASIVLALVIVDRLFASAFVPWQWMLPALVILAMLAAAVLWLRNRPDEQHVALLVDERLDLREKLSTALHVADRDDSFARAAVEDAVAAARDPSNHERVRRQFRPKAPEGWWISPSLAVLAGLIALLDPLDLFSRDEPDLPEVSVAQHEVRETLDAVLEQIQQKPELHAELSDLLGDLADEANPDSDAFKSPEQVRREAIKRITNLNDRLEDMLSGEQAQTMQAIQDALKQMKMPNDGPAKELAQAMASGDFQEANHTLQELIDKVQSGELTPEQQQQLTEQLTELANQLQEMAEQKDQMENALRRAGMDPQLANNPEALKQALENNQNLNEQQRQQLMHMAQSQQACNNMLEGLGSAAMALAEALADGQAVEGAGQMSDQLSQLEQAQMLLQQAQLAQGMCQGMCQSLGQGLSMNAMPGISMTQGQGQGSGPRGVAPTPTRMREVRAEGQTGEGDIIARMLVHGPQIVGKSRITPSQIIADVVEGYEEGLDEDQLLRKYHEAQKRYFGELERRARETESSPSSDSSSKSDQEQE